VEATICELGWVIWLVPLIVTAAVSIWVGRQVVSKNAPRKVPLANGDFIRPAGSVRLQILLMVLALTTTYIRERGLECAHATSWLFGLLAAYLPSLMVVLVHNARVHPQHVDDYR